MLMSDPREPRKPLRREDGCHLLMLLLVVLLVACAPATGSTRVPSRAPVTTTSAERTCTEGFLGHDCWLADVRDLPHAARSAYGTWDRGPVVAVLQVFGSWSPRDDVRYWLFATGLVLVDERASRIELQLPAEVLARRLEALCSSLDGRPSVRASSPGTSHPFVHELRIRCADGPRFDFSALAESPALDLLDGARVTRRFLDTEPLPDLTDEAEPRAFLAWFAAGVRIHLAVAPSVRFEDLGPIDRANACLAMSKFVTPGFCATTASTCIVTGDVSAGDIESCINASIERSPLASRSSSSAPLPTACAFLARPACQPTTPP